MKTTKSKLKLNKVIFLLLSILFIVSCGVTEDPRKNENNIKALDDVKNSFEGKIYEAIITEANVLYVSVEDNGVEQSGFAHTLCNILKEHNATTKWVKIVKAGSTKDPKADNSYGILLGEAHCN